MDEGIDLVVFLPQNPGVVGIGADPLDAEQQGVLQGQDIGIGGGIGFEAHGFGLLDQSLLGGFGLKGGRAGGKIDLAPFGHDFGLEAFPQKYTLIDKSDQPLGIEINVGQGRKRRFAGKGVDIPVADADFAAFHGHLRQPLEAVNQ